MCNLNEVINKPIFFRESLDALNSCWEYSQINLNKIQQALLDLDCDDSCVVLAGSYARREASDASDLDYFIISDNVEDFSILKQRIERVAIELTISLPNPDGVFANQILLKDLTENAGSATESLSNLAQRMLLLLESTSIYNTRRYKAIVNEVIDRYLQLVIKEPMKFPVYLLNDTIRYFRSICVNYQHNFWHNTTKWTLRNIKLRHSRIIMYAGLLLVILNSSIKENKPKYIKEMLQYTPLERIVLVLNDNHKDPTIILDLYNLFLDSISKEEVRVSLQVDYDNRYNNEHFRKLKSNSDDLQKELSKCIYSMQGIWPDEVFEYLIF